jgi:hypothetical protein
LGATFPVTYNGKTFTYLPAPYDGSFTPYSQQYQVRIMLCPSDTPPGVDLYGMAMTNYMTCRGDFVTGTGYNKTPLAPTVTPPAGGGPPGVLRGMFNNDHTDISTYVKWYQTDPSKIVIYKYPTGIKDIWLHGRPALGRRNDSVYRL